MSNETLAQFVRRIREKNSWSLSDVARQSGDAISTGYISMIENERVASPSNSKLKALADGLKINVEILRDLSMEIENDLTPNEGVLIASFRQMDKRAQSDCLQVLQMMRDSHPDKQVTVEHQASEHHIEIQPVKSHTSKS